MCGQPYHRIAQDVVVLLAPKLVTQRHRVAVQAAFESKGLKPVFHFSGSRVETGRFQAIYYMGQLDFNLYRPTTTPPSTAHGRR
jgi:hypothetical protein